MFEIKITTIAGVQIWDAIPGPVAYVLLGRAKQDPSVVRVDLYEIL